MDIIQFVNYFKQCFRNNSLSFYSSLLRNDIVNWKQFIKFDKNGYCRNIIYIDKEIEFVIISWLPGQSTPVHFHPNNGCLMKILDGELYEERYIAQNRPIKKKNYVKNDISYIGGSEQHVIHNMSPNVPAISLHIYSPSNFYSKL